MHSFLPSVGFSKIKNRHKLDPVFDTVMKNPDKKIMAVLNSDACLFQMSKDFGEGFGISIVGEVDTNGTMNIEYYFPYVTSNTLTKDKTISIEQFTDRNAYAGVCNDYSIGMSLIFYITNVGEYERSKWMNKPNKYISNVFFSGLSTNGMIILDIDKNNVNDTVINNKKRNKLIEAAKQGDPAAIESLTLEDMDTYNLIGKRTRSEDVLSIVESSFMPIGIETDHYAVIGNILECRERMNTYSGEFIYLLDIECNDLYFTVAINKNHLYGEPAPGRRFKGDIWLQGHILV